MSVTRVEPAGFVELGTRPHWDVASQSLYYVDIVGKTVHKYTPSTTRHTILTLDGPVSFIVPAGTGKNKFIIGMGRKVSLIEWDGLNDKVTKMETLTEVDTDDDIRGNRINDGKCDPHGRLWFGTMGAEPINGQVAPFKGNFYSFESGKAPVKHIPNVHISNGLTWSHDHKKFYYIDSGKKTVEQYDYDEHKGVISNGKIIFSLVKHGIDGMCDGMTIDVDGNLWVAIFNGYRVIKIDPRKEDILLQTIEIPAKQVTSIAFGGPNLDELYVVTAKFAIGNEVLNTPVHGALYKVTGLGTKGIPLTNFKL